MLAAMNKTLPFSLIAAIAQNNVIGRDNQLPWHLPADLKHFKALTLGKPIIMGRKTWDSLGRPLPGRLNLVVTRQSDLQLEGAEVFTTLEAAHARAQEWAQAQDAEEVMLIGGAQLYEMGLAQADRLYLTRVLISPQGDAYFPDVKEADWHLSSAIEHSAGVETPGYVFEVWDRK
jgi:dihydrofolate reductase